MSEVEKKIRRTEDDTGIICIKQIDDKDFEIPLEPDNVTIGTVKDLEDVTICVQGINGCGGLLP